MPAWPALWPRECSETDVVKIARSDYIPPGALDYKLVGVILDELAAGGWPKTTRPGGNQPLRQDGLIFIFIELHLDSIGMADAYAAA